MNGDWSICTVAELQEVGRLLVEDGNHGEYRPRQNEFSDTGVAFIRAADMNEGRVLFHSASCINETALSRIRKGIGRPCDVLLSHKGTVGKVALTSPDCEPFVCSPQTTFWRTLDSSFLNYRFLFYYLQSPYFQEQLSSRKGETDMADYVSLTVQRTLQVAIPSIDEQCAIAHILGSLDDKIELNRQMNETLEAIARALFKSWFVDFDPVYAKMEGRQPYGMDAETASLFPDSFEDSVLGEIPRGWRVGCLGDIADNSRLGVHPEDIPFNTPYIGLEHMPRKSIALSQWGNAEKVASNKFWFHQGDILFGKLRPYFHKVGVAVQDGVCSTDILVVVPKSPEWHGLVLSHVSSVEFINYANAASDGTRMPRTNWHDMKRYEIAIPSKDIAQIFNEKIKLVVLAICSNILQSRTLADIRNALLPKLLSGEIRVKDAEKFVEAVT